MAKYLDESTHYREQKEEPPVTLTATEARQGRLGRPVLIVLICALVLAALAWIAVEVWGAYLAPAEKAPPSTAETMPTPASGSKG